MSKESMARITSPEAIAKRKANPWTLERRDEFLRKQTNEDVERKRERFAQINQEKEANNVAEALAAYEKSPKQAVKHEEYILENKLPF